MPTGGPSWRTMPTTSPTPPAPTTCSCASQAPSARTSARSSTSGASIRRTPPPSPPPSPRQNLPPDPAIKTHLLHYKSWSPPTTPPSAPSPPPGGAGSPTSPANGRKREHARQWDTTASTGRATSSGPKPPIPARSTMKTPPTTSATAPGNRLDLYFPGYALLGRSKVPRTRLTPTRRSTLDGADFPPARSASGQPRRPAVTFVLPRPVRRHGSGPDGTSLLHPPRARPHGADAHLHHCRIRHRPDLATVAPWTPATITSTKPRRTTERDRTGHRRPPPRPPSRPNLPASTSPLPNPDRRPNPLPQPNDPMKIPTSTGPHHRRRGRPRHAPRRPQLRGHLLQRRQRARGGLHRCRQSRGADRHGQVVLRSGTRPIRPTRRRARLHDRERAGAAQGAHLQGQRPAKKAAPTNLHRSASARVSGTNFTQIASETATQTADTATGTYMTWTLATPVLLARTRPTASMWHDVARRHGRPAFPISPTTGKLRLPRASAPTTTPATSASGAATVTTTAGTRPRLPSGPPRSGQSLARRRRDGPRRRMSPLLDQPRPPPPAPTSGWTFGSAPIPRALTKSSCGPQHDDHHRPSRQPPRAHLLLAHRFLPRRRAHRHPGPGTCSASSSPTATATACRTPTNCCTPLPPSATALDPGDDLDTDGLTNLQEYQRGT